MKRKMTKPGNMRAFIYPVTKKMRKVRRKGTKNEREEKRNSGLFIKPGCYKK